MSLRNFGVEVDNLVYQSVLQRAQREGRSLEDVLTEFLTNYAASERNPGQVNTYTVQAGDTLTKIAHKFYGDARHYALIQKANNIGDAGVIWVGQVLVVPPLTGASPAPAPTPSPVSPSPSPASPSPPSTPQPQPAPAPPASSEPTTPTPQPQPGPSPTPESVNPTLLNDDFEEFQPRLREGKPRFWREYPEEYGKYWQVKVISEVEERRTRVMSSPVFGRFAQQYFGGKGLNYAYGGGNSQVIVSQYGYDVVFMQTVAAQPGQIYKFSGLMVSFYKGTDNPATPNKIFKTLGIDPTGGQDYQSSKVVWGKRDDTDHAWINPSVSATAQASMITVFIRIENTEENVGTTELNLVHLDKFKLEG